jgi:hypothetical protein
MEWLGIVMITLLFLTVMIGAAKEDWKAALFAFSLTTGLVLYLWVASMFLTGMWR